MRKKIKQVSLQKPSIKPRPSFAIAAVGASAGGLEALENLFAHTPLESGIAFIVISHLEPSHSSVLPELLQRVTKLKVLQIIDEVKIQPDYVYVIPPAKNVIIKDAVLKLSDRNKTRAVHLPIDFFFQSLAKEEGHKIIGIILSGTGTDGALGLKAIHKAGGLVIVQDPKTAKYPGMPNSALDTGCVECVLSPENIVKKIKSYLNYDYLVMTSKQTKEIQRELEPIFNLLQTHVGHDFSSYKHNTICRRIEKRMNFHQASSIPQYVRYLQDNPKEIEILFKDILIGVTTFFRNPEAFDSLKKSLMKLLRKKPRDYCFRIWVPACATGEEVYSIAICVQECMEELNRHFNVQIFGTDIDEAAIEKARMGVYSSDIAVDVGADRLKKFFTKENTFYKVKKDLRKTIIFAQQNICKDPPFTKLDLLSCRNLLIYFTSELQKKIFQIFYYSLNGGGILSLGSAENIGSFTDLFNTVDKKWKIFERKEGTSLLHATRDYDPSMRFDNTEIHDKTASKKHQDTAIVSLIEKLLLESYAPACIIVDDKDNILYIYGKTGKYLEPATGAANLNLLQMCRPGLKLKLASALKQVTTQKRQVTYNDLQIKDKESDKIQYINLKVRPFNEIESKKSWKVVIIEDISPPVSTTPLNSKHSTHKKLAHQVITLEQELKKAKETLQITIEELETTNEELTSSNEELQSTNEELQSTNEELETSKEELQSLNEELTTVNVELEARIEDLSRANDDMQNLFHSTEIAAIFLDNNLNVKRFTPKAKELTNLIQSDIGRPISDIVSKLKYTTLVQDAKKVLETLVYKKIEVQNQDGEWYQIRMIPYRTLNNMIDGVVITFQNINIQKIAEEKIKQYNVLNHVNK